MTENKKYGSITVKPSKEVEGGRDHELWRSAEEAPGRAGPVPLGAGGPAGGIPVGGGQL